MRKKAEAFIFILQQYTWIAGKIHADRIQKTQRMQMYSPIPEKKSEKVAVVEPFFPSPKKNLSCWSRRRIKN